MFNFQASANSSLLDLQCLRLRHGPSLPFHRKLCRKRKLPIFYRLCDKFENHALADSFTAHNYDYQSCCCGGIKYLRVWNSPSVFAIEDSTSIDVSLSSIHEWFAKASRISQGSNLRHISRRILVFETISPKEILWQGSRSWRIVYYKSNQIVLKNCIVISKFKIELRTKHWDEHRSIYPIS